MANKHRNLEDILRDREIAQVTFDIAEASLKKFNEELNALKAALEVATKRPPVFRRSTE